MPHRAHTTYQILTVLHRLILQNVPPLPHLPTEAVGNGLENAAGTFSIPLNTNVVCRANLPCPPHFFFRLMAVIYGKTHTSLLLRETSWCKDRHNI